MVFKWKGYSSDDRYYCLPFNKSSNFVCMYVCGYIQYICEKEREWERLVCIVVVWLFLTCFFFSPGPQTFSTRTRSQWTRNLNMRNPPCHSKTSLTQQVGDFFFFFTCLFPASRWSRVGLTLQRVVVFFNLDAPYWLCLSLKTWFLQKMFCVYDEGEEGVASAQKQVVEVVSMVTGLTLIPPALLFTLEVLRLLHGEGAPIIHSGDEKGRADWGSDSPVSSVVTGTTSHMLRPPPPTPLPQAFGRWLPPCCLHEMSPDYSF